MGNATKLALATSPYPSVPALLADARLHAITELADRAGNLTAVRDATAFAQLADRVRGDAAAAMARVVTTAGEVLQLAGDIARRLPAAASATREDASEQLAGLVYAGFIAATPSAAWSRLPIYLKAIQRRLEAAVGNPRHETDGLQVIGELEDEYARLCARFPSGPLPDAVAAVGWLLEELRIRPVRAIARNGRSGLRQTAAGCDRRCRLISQARCARSCRQRQCLRAVSLGPGRGGLVCWRIASSGRVDRGLIGDGVAKHEFRIPHTDHSEQAQFPTTIR